MINNNSRDNKKNNNSNNNNNDNKRLSEWAPITLLGQPERIFF